ncbi:ribonuclease H-like protein [Ephemerocybe angulata]|uniref:ribonuclease H n=1 Tax=Ephemerocybe angulata TaxID=980116 RepID=A0A8H6I1U7_9AGAR|nr:ribonuclease H-like protein [Tulosesus angulatus]
MHASRANTPKVASSQKITVYTDGSGLHPGYEEARAGAGVWFGKDDERNRSIRVPEDLPQTNNSAEALAVLVAVKAVPSRSDLTIHTDSKFVIDSLTSGREKAENSDWLLQSNRAVLEETIGRIRKRKGRTTIKKVKGHSGVEGNEEADRLAGEGAQKPYGRKFKSRIPKGERVQGALLSEMTQALLYKGIRRAKATKTLPRRKTVAGLDAARHAAKDTVGLTPTDKTLWKSTRAKSIPHNRQKEFLWKLAHDALKCGSFWDGKPGCEHMVNCPTCEVPETAEHTLTDCPSSGQKVIWSLVGKIMEKRNIPWTAPKIGDITSCGIAGVRNTETGKVRTGASRLRTILIAISAHLIWKLRCEWRMGQGGVPDKTHPKREVHNRWVAMVNRIIKFDVMAAMSKGRIRGAPRPASVLHTWTNTLENETLLLDCINGKQWRIEGVLVGIPARG